MMTISKRSLWPREYLRHFQRKPSLRFVALTWGSRGDVQPFVALGSELIRRGHRVVLAARAPFRSFVEEHGLDFFELEEDGTEELMHSLASSDGGPDGVKLLASWQRRMVPSQFRQFWQATAGADVLLSNAAFTSPALHIAERRGIPIFQAFFDPGFIPTRRYCVSDNRVQQRNELLNLATTRLKNLVGGLFTWDLVNAWRREQRLPVDLLGEYHRPGLLFRLPVLVAWSRELVERPDDWPEWFSQTGRWRLATQQQQPDARLKDFVEAGAPPVYIGFGSWGVHDKKAVTDLLLEALRVTGQRGILHRNTVDGRSSFPADVYVDDNLPHDWLFPRVKAVVHHGGAGTTGAVTTAGVPSVIIPAFFAQDVWGHIVREKGIGTMLSRRELSVDGLASALREVDRPEVRERARALGMRASNEGAEVHAADEIERWLKEAVAGR
ncbi:glycosyltransferase family 1 protein [Archangium violaceum]|uniref:glycosyltransferase n=1 Tax=Archangium violaceum TaxID=83451 RepID=UPI001952484B|nr:glycosyltransferase family 1 protein [Archangium violaceum]